MKKLPGVMPRGIQISPSSQAVLLSHVVPMANGVLISNALPDEISISHKVLGCP